MKLLTPPEASVARLGESASDATTIVLDDEPMLVDEGCVVVEDAVTVSTVEAWMPDDDSGDEVIEVGDEVVFDV